MPSRVAETYRRFAELEASGAPPTYFEWAMSISADDEILARI